MMIPVLENAKVQQFINKQLYSSDLSIAFMADAFHVSVSYFSYWFKREFQITFSEYIWKHRLEQVKVLMEDSSLTIEQISRMVGYDIVSSFRIEHGKK